MDVKFMVFGAMLKTFVNRMMMCISDRWRGYILTIVLFFISSIQLFSQTPNVEESNTICDVKNNTYTFTSGTPRVGYWEVIEGAGVFSNPNSHVNTTITNIAYGKNVFYFWDNSYSMIVPEHVLTILNTKAYAGPDAVQCLPNTTYQLNASDPAEFPGSSGTWTVTQGTGTFSNVNDPKAIVTGLSVGINRFKWTQKSLPGGCGNSSDEVQITIVNTPPNAFAGSDQTICVGQSATISAPAGAGYTYLWNTGATTQSITVTPGVSTNYQVTVTNSNSCTASDDVDIFVDEINFYNLTAVVTKYCLGGTGVTLTLSGSEIGVNYQLKNGALNIGGLVPGTGFELKWINTTAGSYTVEAINPGTGCKETMNGTINVSSNPLPTTFNLTASSLNHCSHTSGVSLTLSGSENGANFQYQLFKNGAPLGAALIGTGGSLVWNNITAGNYFVTATNTLTGCSQNMTGTPAIVSVISPSLFTVAGSGQYCELSGGLPVTLNGSELGMNYQLIKDGSNSGVAKAGSGLGLSWNGNLQGTYTILASNVAGTCTRMMSSNAVLTQKALPSVFDVTAVQTSYCAGSAGVSVRLSGSQAGVDYQLIKNGAPVGSKVSGDGNPIIWPNNLLGAYTIQAIDASLGCTQLMNGTATVSESPLPTQYNFLDAAVTYCSNTTGASIQLISSENGFNFQYQLYKGGVADGASVQGTGNPITWTNKTTGNYTVIATNINTGCKQNMLGTSVVTMLTSPSVYSVSGSGSYCEASSGLPVSLSGSQNADINYQLYLEGVVEEAPKPGTSASLVWANKLKGTYTVVATNTINNCSTSMNSSAIISEVLLPTIYDLSGPSSYCTGTTGVTLTLSGSQVGVQYKLKKGAAVINTKGGTGFALPWLNVTEGDYTIEAVTTNPIACSRIMNGIVKVTPSAPPVASAGADTYVCLGGSVQISASGGVSYSWSPVGTLSNPSVANPFVNPNIPTTYTVTVTDENGCSSTDEVNVDVRQLPKVVTSSNISICNGDPTILTATDNILGNGETYKWSTGSTYDTTNVKPSITTTYTVTLTDVFQCQNTASTIVTVNEKPGVNAGSDIEICKGSTIDLKGTFKTPPPGEVINIWWSHMGENTESITVSPTTTTQYILKGTYASTGCFMQDVVEVKVNPVPVVKFVPLPETQYCSNGNPVELKATLADGVTPVTGTFSCVEAPTAISVNYFNPSVGPLGTRTINFSHTDANSCIGSASMSLEVVAPPAITITGLNATYCSTSAPFTVAADPLDDGNGDFGEWSFSVPGFMGTAVKDNNNGTCTIDPSLITTEGTYTLYYSVKNSSKCIGTKSQPFTLKAGPTAGFLGLPTNICNNGNAITLTGIPGAGTFSGPGILGNTFNPSGLTPGNYTINFSYTDANLCSDDFSQTITVKPLPEIFTVTGGGEYCSNTAGVPIGLSKSTLGVKYTLLHNNSFVKTEPGTGAALPFGNLTLDGTYTISAKDDVTSCVVQMNGSATVTPITIPTQYTLTGPTKYCVGSTGVTLTLDDSQIGVKYILKKDGNPVDTKDGTGDPLTWDNNLNGVYTVEAVKDHPLACTVAMLGSITVNTVANPVITVTAVDNQICSGQTSQLTATGGTTYAWLPDATLSSVNIANPVASPKNTTTYTVKVTDANGCSTTGQVQVVVKPLPQADASTNTTICKGDQAVLTATDNIPGGTETYLWDNGATTDVITVKPSTTTTYYVTITDAFSCSNTASTTVTVNDLPVVNAGPDQTICQGSPAILSRSGDATDWEWSTGEKTVWISVSPVITTDYILRGTNALGCTNQDIVRVTVNPLQVVEFDVATKTQYCSNGASVLLNATPVGGSFSSVTPGAITGNYFNPSVIALGNHTIKYSYTDLNSCNVTASLNVEVLKPTDVTISNVNASYCNTDAKFIVSGSPASNTNGVFGTWTFSGPADAMTPGNGTCIIDPSKITVAGNYTITYNFKNSLGCVSTIPKSFNIKVSPSLSFSGLPATICNNADPITLSGNQSGAGTFSGPGISGNTFNPAVLTPGSYNIKFTYTDLTTSCASSVTNPVTVNATPKIFTVTGGGSICAGDAGLNIGLSGYEAGIRYELFLDDNSTGVTKDGVATAIDFGPRSVPGTYTVIARNIATSCTVPMTGTATIGINPKPLDAQVITGDVSVCPGSVKNYFIPEIQNATYIWDLPAGATITSGFGTRSINVLFGTASGNIKVHGQNSCGDGKESTLAISVKSLPGAPGAFTSGDATVCQNSQNEVYSIGLISDATSYIWTVPSGATIASGQGTQTIVVNYGSAALSGNITVKGRNDCGDGTEKTLPITVTATPELTLNAPSGSITCNPTSVTVSATSSTPNATFDWSAINGGNVSGIVNIPGATSAKANSAGSYIVTVTSPINNTCKIQGTITVIADISAPENVNITATNSGEINCNVPDVTLTASVVGVVYEWTATEGGVVPLGSENFKDIKVSKGGLYELKAINNVTGCFTRAWYRVKELKSSPDISVVNPEDEKLTCSKNAVTLYGNSTTGISYKWTGPSENTTTGIVGRDDIKNPVVNLPGTYTLVVKDANGCPASKTVSVLTDYNPIVAFVNPNPDKITCKNLPVTLSGSVSAPGGSILWTGDGILAGEERTLTPKVSKPGVYVLTVTNPANGCESSASVTVGTNNTVPSVTFPEIPKALTCLNTTTTVKSTTSASNPKFQWSTADGVFVSSTDIQNILVSKGGTYTLTVTDEANGCSNTKTIEVIQDIQKPEAIISAPLYLTCNRPEVQLNGISFTTPIKISWTTVDGHFVGAAAPLTLNPTVDKKGTYKMTITDLDNDCPSEVSVTVIEKKTGPVITSFDKTLQVLTCALPKVTLSGNAVGATKLLWTGPVGANISDPAGQSTKVDTKGTYTFTATNADGCESSETVTVDENRESPLGLSIVNPGQLNCNSEAIKLIGSSTTPLATYKWIALSGNIISADNDKEVTVNAPGDYKMVVTHPSSFCTDNKIVTVTQDKSAPTINFPETPATITCSNKTSDIKVNVTAGSTLQWTGPGSITNVTISGATVNAAGIYTLKATNPLTGCFVSSTIEVPGDKKSPEFTIANPEAISCAKPEIKVHGIPGADLTDYTALWSTVDGIIFGSPNGIDVLVKKAGLYTLKLINNKTGCEDSQNILVPDNTQKPDIYVDPNPDKITCAVLKVKLYGKTNTGTSMLWSGPGNITDKETERPEVDAIGDYTLTVTGANGCTNTNIVKVLENKNPPAEPIILDPGKINCNKETVDLELSPVPVNADILWTTTGAGKITNETTFKATVNAIGTYTVTVKDRTSGCPVSKDITVYDDRAVSSAKIVGGPYVINCTNETPILEGTTDTGINPVWTATGGGRIISGYSSKKATIDAAGTYIFTVTNPITGCKNSDNIVVTQSADLPKLEVKSYPDVLNCTKKPVELWGQPLEAGTTFTWTASPGHFLPGYENIPNPKVDEPGTYILTVTKTSTGCTSKAAINVIADIASPQVIVDEPKKFTCLPVPVQLKASSPEASTSVLWTTSGTGSIKTGDENTWNPTVLSPATYTITVTNLVNQCTTSRDIVVSQDKTVPDIDVDKTPLQLTCTREQVILSGNSLTPGAVYSWSTSGAGNISNSSSKTPAVDAIGTYTLKVTNPLNGCSVTDIVEVTMDDAKPYIWANPTPSILNCIRDTVYLKGNSSTSNVTYLWEGPGIISNPAAKEPFVNAPGVYTLKVTSVANGCYRVLPVTVKKDIRIPEAPLLTGNASCLGAATNALTAVGNDIQWYNNAALVNESKVQIGNSFSPSGLTAAGDYSFYATQKHPVSQCESPAAQVIYTVKSLPSAPVNINRTICEGDPNTTLTAAGDIIKWYLTPGEASVATGTYTPAVSAPGIYTYFITQTVNNCESPTKDVTLTIQPKPAKPVVNQLNASVCFGGVNPVFAAAGTDLKWYTSPSLPAPVKTGGTFTPLETTAGTYSYYVTQSAYGCVSPYETVTLNIRPVPQAFTVTGGGIYCENTNGLAIGLDGSQMNTSYQLILNGTTVVTSKSGDGAAIDFGLQKSVGNYTVKAIDGNSCEMLMNGGVTIASNPLPGNALTITGPASVCEGAQNVTYSIPAVDNANSYSWSIPAGSIITSGLNTRQIAVDFNSGAVTGQISVYANNACGSGAVSPNLQVIVSPLPKASGDIKNISGNDLVCLGDSGKIYEVDPILNATFYEWVLPAGTTVYSGANSRQIRVKFASNAPTGNQVIKVRGVNSCGSGKFSALYNITVNPNPSVYAGIDQNLCSTQTNLQGSLIPVGGTGVWNQVLGYSSVISNTQPSTQVNDISQGLNIFTWKITYNGCSSTDTVRVYNNKVDVEAGESLPICSPSITLRGSVPQPGTSGVWTVKSGSASFAASSQHNTTVTNFGYGDNKLYWTVTKNGCESRDSITITNYRPLAPDAGADQTICTSNTALAAVTPVYGIGKWSVYSGKATFVNNSDPKTAISSVGKGKNKLVWTVTNLICSLSDTVVITNNELDVNAGYDQIICENRTTLEATAAPSGSTGQWSVLLGSASFLDNRINNTKISGLVNGPNKLIWSLTRGSCVNTDTVTIICNMPSVANAGPDQFLGGANTTLEGNLPVVGTGRWSIISGAATFANVALHNTAVTGLNPGANILRWTISYNNCNTFDEVTITNGTIEAVDAGQDQVICTNQTVLEAARPQYGFGIWSVQRGSANFENNETYNTKVTNLATGTNVLRWSVVVSGIEFFDTVTIVNNQPTLAITGPRQILCIDSSALTGNIPIQGTGRWTLEGGSATIHNVNQNTSKVTGLGSGENIFRWTITKGTCVSSTLLVITNDKTTQADAGMDQTICDDKTTLIPSPAYIGTGEWSVVSGSGRFTNNDVSGLATGRNVLRWIIRKNNCSSYDDMVVISHKPTAASAGINTVVCVDSLNLAANRPNSAIGEFGRWTIMNGSGQIKDSTLNTSLITRLAQGVNVLRWTINNHGCISSGDVQINYAFVGAEAGIDMATCNNHIILNANNPTLGKGEWSVVGGSGTAVFTDPNSPNTEVKNLDQGKNILKWTINNFSCFSSSEVIITNNAPSVSFAGGDQSLCINNTTLAARQPFIGKGSWTVLSGSGLFADSSAFNSRVYNIGPGTNTYRWTVRNQNCLSTDEVVVYNNKPIGTYAGLDQVLCLDSAKLTANQPIVGNGVWSITKGAGQITDVYNAVTSVLKLAPDTNILRWTVTNKQCMEFQEIEIINNLPTIPSAGADRVICSDQTTMDGNLPLHGNGEWFVISGSGTFVNKNVYNTEVRGLTLGKNIFRWKISKNGCVLNDDVVLTNDLPTKPQAGTDIAICDNNSPLNANKPVVGKGYWSIVSGHGIFLDSTQHNTRIVGLGQGSNLLTWTTVHNRCALTDVVEVRNNQTNVYAGPDQVVFENSSILVSNEPQRGLGRWSLNGGGGNISSPTSFESVVTGLEQGINTFLWSVDISGCISSDAVQITYYRIPTASFSISGDDGCPPHQVKFTKTTIENYPYKWYFGDKDSVSSEENPVFTYENPGSYSAKLVVTGPDGKPVEMVKTITVHDKPVARFELVPQKVYLPEGELKGFNYSIGAQDYLWDFGNGDSSDELNPTYAYKDSGTYTVKLKVWSEFGCLDSSTIENGVEVIQSSMVKFPSAFTPNMNGATGGEYNRNDYSNDVFYPIVITGEITEYHLEIYNRWGVLIFESKDINIGWDGYYKEKLMMEDVYIYRVSGRLNNGRKINQAGDFLLMRKDY